jgi:hypothetical protein
MRGSKKDHSAFRHDFSEPAFLILRERPWQGVAARSLKVKPSRPLVASLIYLRALDMTLPPRAHRLDACSYQQVLDYH